MTLIEVLIASGLMALFTLGVGDLLTSAYGAHARGGEVERLFTSGALGLDYMGRELRYCDRLLSPNPIMWQVGDPYIPEKGVRPPFVFERYDPTLGGDLVVAYEWDSKSKYVNRILFPKDFPVPIISLSQSAHREKIIATSVEKFSITRMGLLNSDTPFAAGSQLVMLDMQVASMAGHFPLNLQIWAKQF